MSAGPAAYDPSVRETHVGIVFLVGDRAYKIKKAVHNDFLDFRTADRRRAACRRELELNRRLAPDVYLGISELLRPADPDGRPVAHGGPTEPVVVMRRMPDDRRLATLVTTGAPVSADLRALARTMARFHAGAERGDPVTADGTRDALAARWRSTFDALAPYAGPVLDPAVVGALERLATRFLDGRGPLFTDRIAHDRVVDGHGDLTAADVFCLDDGPRALDCLEFDDHLRHVDGLDDVAFLAMDLERLGRPDLATDFLDAYVEFSGDPAPAALRHHYIAYRAVVRAKVACLRRGQGDPAAAADAVQHAGLALRHLERGAVRLALVGGLPGTGKSTLGGGLADRFGAVLLGADRVRKELAGIDPADPAGAPFRQGLYTAAHTAATYAELLRRAAMLLARGESVVLDASWTDAGLRAAAADVARRTGSDLVALHCQVDSAVAEHRIAGRAPTGSDATAAVAREMAAAADPWPQACPVPTGTTPAAALAVAERAWSAAPARAPRPAGPVAVPG
ncbi:AAA family ATPase [Pseudonocardia petroleophila]|uniref:AAA family ATPase n=1 Tax=Pseudonocardia petroleophila TaxID=37331 RepID=A0A7G7MF12_9PSEU|nr:AAA family ATPase [Pseudonocardia petroleophila]QNG51373.1 AAA family ATPase [Pseudonocardia petroleophila]